MTSVVVTVAMAAYSVYAANRFIYLKLIES